MLRLSASLLEHPPEGTVPLPFRAVNASLPKHNFHLSFAPDRPCTLFATLVRHECTSSSGLTERPAATPSSDSEAAASEFSTCGPGTASLATTCHHAECADCTDCAADVARNGEGLSDAERGNAAYGSAGSSAQGRFVQRDTLCHTILTFWKE